MKNNYDLNMFFFKKKYSETLKNKLKKNKNWK
jgi:hypothetical protein